MRENIYNLVVKTISDILPPNTTCHKIFDYEFTDRNNNIITVDILLFLFFEDSVTVQGKQIKSVILPINVTDENDSFYNTQALYLDNIPCTFRGSVIPSGDVSQQYSPQLSSHLKNKLGIYPFIRFRFYHHNINLKATLPSNLLDVSTFDSSIESYEELLKYSTQFNDKDIIDDLQGTSIEDISSKLQNVNNQKTIKQSEEYTSKYVKLINKGSDIGEDIKDSLDHLFKSIDEYYQDKFPNYIKIDDRFLAYVFINTRMLQSIDDIDIIVLLSPTDEDYNNSRYYSFTIEVKRHSKYKDNIDKKNNTKDDILVKYGQSEKSVFKQCESGVFALHKFLFSNKYIRRTKYPNIMGMLWFPNVTNKKDRILNTYYYIVHNFNNQIVEDMLKALKEIPNKSSILFSKSFFRDYTKPSKTIPKNSQKYINETTKIRWDNMKTTNYYKNLNEGKTKRLQVQGAAGTGKTFFLLGIASNLRPTDKKTAMLVSYNRVLAAYVNYIIPNITWEKDSHRKIYASPIIRWYREIIRELSVNIEDGFYVQVKKEPRESYQTYKDRVWRDKILPEINKQLIANNTIKNKYTSYISNTYSMVLIDEAQDLSHEEETFMRQICEDIPLIIAISTLQQTRVQKEDINPSTWKEFKGSTDPTLSKILRSKTKISDFIIGFKNQFLEEIDEEYKRDDTQAKGNIKLVSGDNFKEKIKELMNHSKNTISQYNSTYKDNKDNRDILICVTTSYKGIPTKDFFSKIEYGIQKKPVFYEESYLMFDDEESNKDIYPTNTDLYRVMHYESCRGSEGWVVLLCAIDVYYDLLMERYNNDTLKVYRQILVAISRAADTLIIHFRDEAHPLYEELQTLIENPLQYEFTPELHKEDTLYDTNNTIDNKPTDSIGDTLDTWIDDII